MDQFEYGKTSTSGLSVLQASSPFFITFIFENV